MGAVITCLHCSKKFSVAPCRADKAKYCSPKCRHLHLTVALTCAVCGKRFRCPQSRKETAKYCSKTCANVGQAQTRGNPWNKGQTKATDSRLANVSRLIRKQWQDPQYRQDHTGKNHPFYGQTHTEEARQKMRDARAEQEITPAMLDALDAGRAWCKGLTKEDHPGIAQRAETLSELYTDRPNPEHGERMRQYYQEHPEKHPNRIMAQKGYETSIEQIMREALEAQRLPFEIQHPIGSRFADFAFLDARLVVEVDGEHWHTPEQDAIRDAELEAQGWRVIHFTETEVNVHLDQCVATILEILISSQHPDAVTQ